MNQRFHSIVVVIVVVVVIVLVIIIIIIIISIAIQRGNELCFNSTFVPR